MPRGQHWQQTRTEAERLRKEVEALKKALDYSYTMFAKIPIQYWPAEIRKGLHKALSGE